MKVEIIRGPHTDKNIFACYDYLINIYRKEHKHDSKKEKKRDK